MCILPSQGPKAYKCVYFKLSKAYKTLQRHIKAYKCIAKMTFFDISSLCLQNGNFKISKNAFNLKLQR